MEATEIPTTTATDLWAGAQILVTVRDALVAATVLTVDLIDLPNLSETEPQHLRAAGPVSKGSTKIGYVEVHLSGGEQVALRPLSQVTVVDGMLDPRG